LSRGRSLRPGAAPSAPRDQQESAFSPILAGLLGRLPGGRAAALVDVDGETVDYAGAFDPYDARLAAAHWRIVLDRAGGQPALSRPVSIAARTTRATYAAYALPEGYALVLVLGRGADVGLPLRAVSSCIRLLAAEAGWAATADAGWHPVEVLADERRRPSALVLGGGPRPLEVLGAVASGLTQPERGWRVRTEDGNEVTLVREPGGFWYSDQPLVAGDLPASYNPAPSRAPRPA
jgi:hypothetical protein